MNDIIYPSQIDIMVGTHCDAQCAFCVQEATYKADSTSNNNFLKALEKHFRDFYDAGGRKVVITGGEPLLHFSRVLAVLDELNKYPDLAVKALYSNSSKMLNMWGKETLAEVLKSSGLGCVNMSVHHYNHAKNNTIFGLPNKVSVEEVARHLVDIGMPFRFNLVLQKGGIDSIDTFLHYVDWALDLGAQDIYVRELFQFSFQELMSSTDRDPISYSHSHYVSIKPLLHELSNNHPNFQFVNFSHEESRDKSEYQLIHQPTQKNVYLSQLVVGSEDVNEIPYLVLMPDGNLYKGWLGKNDIIRA